MELMSLKAMHKRCGSTWNRYGKVPVNKWLWQEADEMDKERLKAVGNIVMPRVAQMALHVMAHEMNWVVFTRCVPTYFVGNSWNYMQHSVCQAAFLCKHYQCSVLVIFYFFTLALSMDLSSFQAADWVTCQPLLFPDEQRQSRWCWTLPTITVKLACFWSAVKKLLYFGLTCFHCCCLRCCIYCGFVGCI